MNIGPHVRRSARAQLYAEIASIEEQHVTQYESLIDPDRDAGSRSGCCTRRCEVYNYWSCMRPESEPAHQGDLGALPRLRARPSARSRASCSSTIEKRDPAEVLPRDAAGADRVREPARRSCARCWATRSTCAPRHRFIAATRRRRIAVGLSPSAEPQGSPSEIVCAGYRGRRDRAEREPPVAGAPFTRSRDDEKDRRYRTNRTGIATSPIAARQGGGRRGERADVARRRARAGRRAARVCATAEPVGTMPPPATLKGWRRPR